MKRVYLLIVHDLPGSGYETDLNQLRTCGSLPDLYGNPAFHAIDTHVFVVSGFSAIVPEIELMAKMRELYPGEDPEFTAFTQHPHNPDLEQDKKFPAYYADCKTLHVSDPTLGDRLWRVLNGITTWENLAQGLDTAYVKHAGICTSVRDRNGTI